MMVGMVAVLCYHKVGEEQAEGRWINISPETLASHIEFFQRRNYKVVQAASLSGKLPERSICLTFDDAYESTLANGLPVLEKLGVPATFYAVSEYVGKDSDWDGEKAAKLAGWDELKRAQKAGIEIGNHTHAHLDLSKLSQDEQVAQIEKCSWLMRECELNPETFCIPFGKYNKETSKAIEQAGFGVGFTVEKRWAKESDDRRLLPRFAMSYGDNMPALLYKLFVRPKMLMGR